MLGGFHAADGEVEVLGDFLEVGQEPEVEPVIKVGTLGWVEVAERQLADEVVEEIGVFLNGIEQDAGNGLLVLVGEGAGVEAANFRGGGLEILGQSGSDAILFS